MGSGNNTETKEESLELKKKRGRENVPGGRRGGMVWSGEGEGG